MDETKIMTTEQISIQVSRKIIEKVEDTIYLGHYIKLEKENQQKWQQDSE